MIVKIDNNFSTNCLLFIIWIFLSKKCFNLIFKISFKKYSVIFLSCNSIIISNIIMIQSLIKLSSKLILSSFFIISLLLSFLSLSSFLLSLFSSSPKFLFNTFFLFLSKIYKNPIKNYIKK